jgi:hypothetical protein
MKAGSFRRAVNGMTKGFECQVHLAKCSGPTAQSMKGIRIGKQVGSLSASIRVVGLGLISRQSHGRPRSVPYLQ